METKKVKKPKENSLKYGDKKKIAEKFNCSLGYVMMIEDGRRAVDSPKAQKIKLALETVKKNNELFKKQMEAKMAEIEQITIGDLDDDGIDEGAYAD